MGATAPILSKDIIRPIAKRSDLWGAWLTFHVWAVCLAAGALFVLIPNPLTFILAFLIIGSRQHGMAILMHDAAHGVLFKTKALNEFVGTWFLAAPYGGNMQAYRHYHLKHHKHTQTELDPDLPLSAKFPTSKASLKRKLIRDLTGQTFWRLRLASFKGIELEGSNAFAKSSRTPILITNLILFSGLAGLGVWWAYFALWLFPLMTWFMAVLRIRNIAEHAMTATDGNPFRYARTTNASLPARIFLAPYWVNYHLEHHAYMYVPCYRLPTLHNAMKEAGYLPKMEYETSYTNVLKLASTG